MNINGNWMNFAYMDNPTLYGSGKAIQHLHYLPFGEDWVDQRNSSWNAPYTFSGKEKDVETGYGYFGARYYDSGLSIWLSVDPMSDKYPSMSPYNYCANNPVILVDPDGRCFKTDEDLNIIAEYRAELTRQRNEIEAKIQQGTDRENFKTELSEISQTEFELKQLETSTTEYTFRIEKNADPRKGGTFFMEKSGNDYIGIIQINFKDLGIYSHELKHAFQFDNKELSFLQDGKTVGTMGSIHTEREAYNRSFFVGQNYLNIPTNDQIRENKGGFTYRSDKIDPNSDIYKNDVVPWMISNKEIFKR